MNPKNGFKGRTTTFSLPTMLRTYVEPDLSKLAFPIGRFGQRLLKTNQPSQCIGTSPEGTVESSPARSAAYTFPARPVPQGRLKITQDVSPG
jgi:hypothetical protein